MLYMTFASLFIAQAYGVPLTLGQELSMLLVLMLTSKGIAGVPRAALVVIAGTLSLYNIPQQGLLLLLGIDQILDMARSATNVLGNRHCRRSSEQMGRRTGRNRCQYKMNLFYAPTLNDHFQRPSNPNPEFYINNGGLWVLLFIVFAETGLMFGFFLPGDSLLFVAGIYNQSLIKRHWLSQGCHDKRFSHPDHPLGAPSSVCGIFGNAVGYWFGNKSGPFLFHRKDNWLFKQKHLYQAKEFYDKPGGEAIIFARFLPHHQDLRTHHRGHRRNGQKEVLAVQHHRLRRLGLRHAVRRPLSPEIPS